MDIQFWDKKTAINDTDAQEFLASMPHLKNGRVITIANASGTITQVESVDVLTANLTIDATNMSAQEIYDAYLASQTSQKSEIDELKQTVADLTEIVLNGGIV